jgi:hypothetical protein
MWRVLVLVACGFQPVEVPASSSDGGDAGDAGDGGCGDLLPCGPIHCLRPSDCSGKECCRSVVRPATGQPYFATNCAAFCSYQMLLCSSATPCPSGSQCVPQTFMGGVFNVCF